MEGSRAGGSLSRRSSAATSSRPLAGETVIVTGAGHGIGAAFARGCALAGAAVVLADIDRPAVEHLAAALTTEGAIALAVRVDVADVSSIEEMVAIAQSTFGSVTGLVNNAAVFATVPISRVSFDEISEEEWDRVMEVNVKGVWLACRAVVPGMRAQRHGKIVNISSAAALAGSATRAHYVASKSAVIGLTKSLAREVGRFGITVNSIAPGSTLSVDAADEQTIELRQRAVASRALERVQYPDDLVGAAVFLLSVDSDFVTGQTLVVDGGVVMH